MSILALVVVAWIGVVAWRRWTAPPGPTWVADPGVTPVTAFVRIPLPLAPLDRHERFEVPLDEALQGGRLGRVEDAGLLRVGREVVGATIELRLGDADRAVPLVVEVLRAAGAPAETTVSWTSPEGPRETRVGAVA